MYEQTRSIQLVQAALRCGIELSVEGLERCSAPRRKQKGCGVIIEVDCSKLGMGGDGVVDVQNVIQLLLVCFECRRDFIQHTI